MPDSPSPAGPLSPERPSATIRVGLGRDPVSIDPRHLADDEGEFVVRALFDGLVDLSPDGTIVPASAERVEFDADRLTIRFFLGDDRFHNGESVTAQHHADALLAVFDPERAPRFRDDLLRSLRGAEIAPTDAVSGRDAAQTGASRVRPARGLPDDVLAAGGIEVVGPRELVLRLTRPDAMLLHELTDPALVPLPRAAELDPAGFAQEPIGNGPFRMVGPREPGAFIRIAANREHVQPPLIDGLVLQVYGADPDRRQRWEDLQAGRLQIAAVPPELRDDARERFGRPVAELWGSGLHESAMPALYAYGFAIDVAPFGDVRLRRAVSAAIDRVGLAAEVRGASVEPADAILPPVVGGRREPCAHCVHDPQLARELFDEWALEGAVDLPVPITLAYPRGAGHATIAERIAADLERTLDVSVRLQSRDLASLVRGVESGESPLFRYGLRATRGGEAVAAAMLDPAFRPEAIENWVRWSGAGTAALLDELAITHDPQLAREIEAAVLSDAAVIPLLWTRHDLVVHPDVIGFRLDPTGRWWPERVRLR